MKWSWASLILERYCSGRNTGSGEGEGGRCSQLGRGTSVNRSKLYQCVSSKEPLGPLNDYAGGFHIPGSSGPVCTWIAPTRDVTSSSIQKHLDKIQLLCN